MVVFIYVSNELPEREIRKTISLKLHQEKIPRNQPDQGEKDLYTEKYKLLIKETEDDSKKWKDILFSCTVKINIIIMAILPKAIYRFNTIRIKLHFSQN